MPPCEAEFNNTSRSHQEIALALAQAPTRDVSVLAALALSRIGEIERMAHGLAERFPLNTAIMYAPPPCCKRVEVGEDSVRVNVSGLLVENRSPGLDDDPRVPVLINRSATRDALSPSGFPVRRWTVLSSPSLLSRPW